MIPTISVSPSDEDDQYPDVVRYDAESADEILQRMLLALIGKEVPNTPLKQKPARDSYPLWQDLEEKKAAYEGALAELERHYAEKRSGTFGDRKLRLERFKKLMCRDKEGTYWVSGRGALKIMEGHRALIYAAIEIGWLEAVPHKKGKDGKVKSWRIKVWELIRWKHDLEENFDHVQIKELLAKIAAGVSPDDLRRRK